MVKLIKPTNAFKGHFQNGVNNGMPSAHTFSIELEAKHLTPDELERAQELVAKLTEIGGVDVEALAVVRNFLMLDLVNDDGALTHVFCNVTGNKAGVSIPKEAIELKNMLIVRQAVVRGELIKPEALLLAA